ncbi:MAG: hypothetical protein ABFD82_18465 [Syntrophaceae bacterium]
MNERNEGCEETKEPTKGEQLLSMARRIASEAEVLSKMTEDKLNSISTPVPTTGIGSLVVPMSNETPMPERPWPPYFDELRDILKDISSSIIATKKTINRVEL